MQQIKEYIAQVKRLSSHRSYRRLLAGGLISALGDRAGFIAFLAAVSSASTDALAVGGITIAETLPGVVAAPIVSYFVDRYDRRKLLLIADVVRAIVFTLAFFYPEEWLIYPLVFIAASFAMLFEPARMALEPHYIPEGEIAQANGMRMGLMSIVMILGPALGGLLVAVAGYKYAILFDGLTFAFSGLMVARLDAVEYKERKQESTWNEMMGGVRAVRSSPILMFIFLLFGAFLLAVGIQFPLIYVFVEENLKGGPTEAGWLFSAIGVGGIIGGAAIAAFKKQHTPFDATIVRGRVQILSLVALDGIVVLILSSLHSIVPAMGVFVVFGFIGTSLNTGFQSAVTMQTQEHERGRVFALYSILAGPLMILSIAVGTPFAREYGASAIFRASGLIELVVVLLAYRFATRNMKTEAALV